MGEGFWGDWPEAVAQLIPMQQPTSSSRFAMFASSASSYPFVDRHQNDNRPFQKIIA